ncbi:MAG: sugar ABC transporter ATP-binding protein [Spirochaetaceae bacterium]|jgi:ribose transport system ATP-binding protein|nr:sugar ABC transporter ATP-binding protein [Spirochaetaceae bacterium]
MQNILRMENVTKSFPGVRALDNVRFELNKGEVHALAGENGAGKSTFMKILTGIYKLDEGAIFYKGKPFIPLGPKHAQDMGISIIHQELNLLPDLTVADNIYVAREPRSRFKGIIDDKKMTLYARELLKNLGLSIDARVFVKDLSIAEQQMVEIAKALAVHSEVLVLDEPTSALSITEAETLFNIIRRLRSEGVGIIYISHRLEEFEEIVDRVTVLRDGKYISTHNWKQFSLPFLIKDMVGRDMTEEYPKRNCIIGDVFFEVKNLTRRNSVKTVLDNISLNLRRGEVLGLAGLMGAGRTELARSIIAAEQPAGGTIVLNGKKLKIKSPSDAIENGITYLPEDRKGSGLFLDQNVEFNITVANLNSISRAGILNNRKGELISSNKVAQLRIKTPNLKQNIRHLSGGNQQKVLVGRWLCRDFAVVIFDEPTRGIDVGAKYEVYNLINQIVQQGAGVIMISSEMSEIIGMSDRIFVMCEGKITGELDVNDATQEKILELASGTIKRFAGEN